MIDDKTKENPESDSIENLSQEELDALFDEASEILNSGCEFSEGMV